MKHNLLLSAVLSRALAGYFTGLLLIVGVAASPTAWAAFGLLKNDATKTAEKADDAQKAAEDPAAVVADRLAEAKKLLHALISAGEMAGLTDQALIDARTERENLLRSIVHSYERHLNILNELQERRKTHGDLKTQAMAWSGFESPPPYSIDMVDRLWEETYAISRKIDIDRYELGAYENYIKELRANVEASDQALRADSEALEAAKDPAAKEIASRTHELTKLRHQLNETQLAEFTDRRQLAKETLSYREDNLKFLQHKSSTAAATSPLTEEDLAKKIEGLKAEQQNLRKEIDTAKRTMLHAEQRLERAREDLTRKRERVDTATNKERATADALRAERMLQVRSAQAEMARRRVEILHNLNEALTLQMRMWEDRYTIHTTHESGVLKEIELRIDNLERRTDSWRAYVNTHLETLRGQITNQQDRLANWETDQHGDIKLGQELLNAYQEHEAFFKRVRTEVERTRTMLLHINQELEIRIASVPITVRLKGYYQVLAKWGGELWKMELFVVEDSIVVEGREITGKRGITIGEVLEALLMVTVGIWLMAWLTRKLHVIAEKRFKLDTNSATLLHRGVFLVLTVTLVVIALNTVQIPLTVFAFLGGALAVAVGFGAQTLVGNFLSGLIILLERPIKVGDIIEVEGVRGRVMSIGGRCCQVKRFDGVDILVPNSTILEKNVTNITLSDQFMRLRVAVGVAYGSSTRDTTKAVSHVLEEHGKILKDPKPIVLFEDFGDSALLFSSYFWVDINEVSDWREVASDVRYMIERTLREANITIAFPQRDVHMYAAEPIPVQMATAAVPAAEKKQGSKQETHPELIQNPQQKAEDVG